MSALTLRRSGTLSNLTWYKATEKREDGLYVEVCSNDFKKVDGKLVVRRPSTYGVTTSWWPPRARKVRQIRFTYEPKRTATGGRLADATVTRLVREHMQGQQ